MQLSTITAVLQEIAPLEQAEPWDNVGLLIGDPAQTIRSTLLTIDYTADVAAEAVERKCDFVIAYHPLLFKPIKRLVANTATGAVWEAARRGIAIYSPHTAWDAAPGGANDFLADVLMLKNVRPLRLNQTKAQHCRLVTYIPPDHVEPVAEALYAAGAGKLEHYSRCGFRSEGVGTFEGDKQSHPAIGEAGQFETTKEIKFETIVPLDRIEAVVASLKQIHPYETPAFDLLSLIAAPTGIGMGRIGSLPGELTAEMLLNHVKHELGVSQLIVAGPIDKLIRTPACCAGAGDDLLDDAIKAGADFYLTGEMRHHEAIRAASHGMVVACTLHSNSERGSLKRLQSRLAEMLPAMTFHLSAQDRDPYSIR